MSPLVHPIPAEWLMAYYDGELGAVRRDQVAAHLPECAECRRQLDELKTLSQALAAAELPQAALSGAEAFWGRVQSQLPDRPPARPAPARLSARGVVLRWSPGISLLLLYGVVQVAAVAGTVLMLLTLLPSALAQAPAWTAWLYQLASGSSLGWLGWLLPANWSGWGLLLFWITVSAELAVLYLAWLGYELRYGPLATFGPAMAERGN